MHQRWHRLRPITFLLVALFSTLTVTTAQAAIHIIELSPPGTDHAVGITAPNAVGMPPSPATGNILGGGITFDDVSKVLSFEFAYGSDFGFVDLVGDYLTAHVHSPSPILFPAPNAGAGVMFGLDPFHTPGSSTKTGSYLGSMVLGAADEAELLGGLAYINIHSTSFGGGEIRGQLIPTSVVPLPAGALLLLGPLGLLVARRR